MSAPLAHLYLLQKFRQRLLLISDRYVKCCDYLEEFIALVLSCTIKRTVLRKIERFSHFLYSRKCMKLQETLWTGPILAQPIRISMVIIIYLSPWNWYVQKMIETKFLWANSTVNERWFTAISSFILLIKSRDGTSIGQNFKPAGHR